MDTATNRITLNKYISMIQNFDRTKEYFDIYKEACKIDLNTVWTQHRAYYSEQTGIKTEEGEIIGSFQKGLNTLKSWWEKIVKWFLGLFKFLPKFLKKFFNMFSNFSMNFTKYKNKTSDLYAKIKERYAGDSAVSTAWEEWTKETETKYKRKSSAFNYKQKFEPNKSIHMMIAAQYVYHSDKEYSSEDGDSVLNYANKCAEKITKLLHQGVDLFLDGEVPETGIQNMLDGKLRLQYKDGRGKGNSLLAILYNTEKLIDTPVTVKMPSLLIDLPKDFNDLTNKMDDFFKNSSAKKNVTRVEDLEIYKFLKDYRNKVNKEYTLKEYELTKATFTADERELKDGVEKLEDIIDKVKDLSNDSELKSSQSSTQTMLETLNCMARAQALFLDNISTLYQLVIDSFELRFKIIDSFNKFLDSKKK